MATPSPLTAGSSPMLETTTALADWVLILPVALTLAGAALLLVLRGYRALHAPIALLVVLAVGYCDFQLFLRVFETGPMAMTMGNWLPPFGITFAADMTSAAFALVAAAVTGVVLIYVQMEPPGNDGAEGFYALVLLLLAGVSGAFLTGDLFNLYVWFEVMLIATFGLLAFRGRTLELDATIKYGFLNFLATTFFLIALGLIYGLLGTLNIADITLRAQGADPAVITPIAAVLLLAFGMKAAAFPVNAWLPAAYHAPSPAVSALLAGLPTKVGVYALLRTLVAILPEARETLYPVIVVIAAATLILAPLGAIAETNLRRALGFIVMGGIGAVIAGLAMSTTLSIQGALIYVVHAMAAMTALYLVAGLIERTTNEIDTRRMGGLYAANGIVSVLFLGLVLAVAGVPPFLGFWPKLLLVQAGLTGLPLSGVAPDYAALWLAFAILLNALLTLIAGTRLWAHIFWRPLPERSDAELPEPQLRPLAGRERAFGLGATVLLSGAIAALSLWPDILFAAGHIAATDMLNPARYVIAVGLGVSP